MDTRVLIALSCLLVAAQARPAAVPSSACSVSCSGRNFWTGYKSGTTLQYTFEQKVELSSGLSKQKSLLMQVTGKANVEVHGDCEMVLTVDVEGTKTSKSPNEADNLDAKTLPKALLDALKEPLRFSFEDGRIQGLCPSGSESRASLNFKRGLLSQLHLSVDKPAQEARVREVDVLGNCYTVYTKLGTNKLEKTKDLSSCNANFEVYPSNGVKFEAPESSTQWPTVVQGTLKCTIELEGDSQVIKDNQCEEERVVENSIGDSTLGERVKVTTSLKLQQKISTVASTLFEVKERGSLNHKHKTGDKCHDSKAWFEEDIFQIGNECQEKKFPTTGTASSDFKALAKKTIEELCEETKSNNMQNSSAAKYADLIKYMRGISAQDDLTSLFDWVKNGYCADNTMLKAIVYSAIPSVGTRQSVQIILNQLKGSDGMSTDKSTADWFASGIAGLPQPTSEIITDVLEATKKAKEESMAIIAKDLPLALSALTGRFCNANPNCESNEAVAAVLSFFSDAIGTNCTLLESQEEQSTDADYAFVSLLATGNIGRATGGAASIIGCAENSKLSLANRVFALRSLRRFQELSTSEKLRLGQLIQSKDLDSELRITAYQVIARFASVSFWSDERVVKKLSDLLQDASDDQQVQRYIYSHLSQWMKKQRRSTDSYTVSNILREYEKVVMESKLSGMQVSSYWRKQFKDPSTKSKLEVESNLIYSKNSMMPRFVNLNLTAESPLSAEAVNLFELGLRMEGLEGIVEHAFNLLNKDNQQDELIRKRRQASLELTDEQKQYKQAPKKMRLDFFTRKNGMQLMHNNLDESILGVMPSAIKTLDYDNVKGLAIEKLSSMSYNTIDQSAGTLMESTISVPTISGFPILIKKELHYLSNIVLKQKFEVASNVKLEFEVQPTVAVHMAKTVTVDTGFERAGLKSQTSVLSSTGLKVSLEGTLNGPNDILFSFKLDPIKKQQTILDLKTDVVFVQHSGASNVIPTPVVSSSEMAPVVSKCFTPTSVKLLGRRLCLETNFEWSSRPHEFVRQNPGSFRLFIDKDDSFGVYEVTLKVKREGRNFDFLAVVGDQKSPDRHAKFQFSVVKTAESRKIKVELANPVLPIKWESESKRSGDGFDIGVGLKFGSTDYVFKGLRTRDPSGDWKLEGNFFRKDKERQQIKIATRFGSYGFLRYLPLFRFDLTATTQSNDKLTFNHLINYASNKFEMSLLASHEKSGSVVTSVKSRLQCSRLQRSATSQTRFIQYDTEVVNKNGKNFIHTFSAKVDRRAKDGVADTWTSAAVVSHKFKHGVSNEVSVIDVDLDLQLEEVIKRGQLYKSSGSGNLNYDGKSIKLTNLRFVLGDNDVLDDHFNTKTFLVEYTVDVDGSQSQAHVALQVLPIRSWSLYNQCMYVTLRANKKVGADLKEHVFELRHTSSQDKTVPYGLPNIHQAAKMLYASQVLLDATHKLFPIAPSKPQEFIAGHTWSIKTFDGQTYASNTRYTVQPARSVDQVKISTLFTVNEERRVELNQTLTLDLVAQKFDYRADCQRRNAFGSFRIYSKYYLPSERRQAMKEIADYVKRSRSEGFSFKKFYGLVRKNAAKIESGLELTVPSSFKLQVTNFVDLSVTNGVFLNFTRTFTTGGTSWKRSVFIYKELEMTPERYRRFYRVNAEADGVACKCEFETVFLRKSNPELKITVSKVAVSGPQGPDFTVSVGGQLVRRFQRDGQIALNLNVTHQCNVADVKSNFRLVVDTAPWAILNPALNVSYAVETSAGQSFNVLYNLGVQKAQVVNRPSIRNLLEFASELTITNGFQVIPFTSYKGITTLSLNRDEPLSFVFKKVLNDMDLINLKATRSPNQFYVGVKSDVLPAKEVSFKSEFTRDSDGFYNYVSKLKLKTANSDYGFTDKGKFKAVGRSGPQLFSFVYSGIIEYEGFNIPVLTGKMDYSGILVAQSSGEFDSNHQVTRIVDSTSENMILMSAKLNYWPFEISSKLGSKYWNIGLNGFNFTAGPRSPDNGFRFKAWIASQTKESAYEYWHTYTKAQRAEVTGQAVFTSGHLFEQKSDKIETTFTVKASSFFDYSFISKTTTPFRSFQMIQYEVSSSDLKQTAVLTFKKNDKQENVLNVDQTIETKADGTKALKISIVITPVNPEVIGIRKITYIGNLVTGTDYAWGFELSKDDTKLATFDIFWLKSGNTYPHLSRLSTPSANLGFDLNCQSNHFHLLRSQSGQKTLWEMKFKGYVEVETKVEFTNGRITSGTGTAAGKTIEFTSPSEGVIEVKAGSGKNTITYSSTSAGSVLQNWSLKFSMDGKESCLSGRKESGLIIGNYGSCTTPNTFNVRYKISDFWNMRKTKVELKVVHTTVPASNQVFYLLPGLQIPLKISNYPFKYTVDADNEKLQGKTSYESDAIKGSQEYDFSKFPRGLTYKLNTNIGVPPVITDQKWVIYYDVDTRSLDIKVEIDRSVKLTITGKKISFEATGVFLGGVEFIAESDKEIVQISWELTPKPGSQPCVLRLWRSNRVGVKKYALEFVEHSGKEIKVVSDVTNFEYTPSEFSMKVATTLSSNFIQSMRSANSIIDVSIKRDAGKYTINYMESFTSDGILYYDVTNVLKGTSGRFPSTVSSILKGYIESDFKYNFNREYDAELYLLWTLTKFIESRDNYKIEFRTKDVQASTHHAGKFWRDFSLELSAPRRQIYLSESCKVLPSGAVQTEIQAFINKRNAEGFVAVFNKDSTQKDVHKKSLQLTLPNRQVGFERVLKKLDGNKIEYNITVFWDMLTSLDKKITIQFSREKERRPSGYYYYHRLDLKAPFLKNKVSKEVLYERKENEFSITWTHSQESVDKVTLKVTGKKNWNSDRGAFQKELNISFAQQIGDVKADVRITLETARLRNQKLPQLYTSSKFIKVLNVYTTVPSQSVDSHVRIRFVPAEEFTFACNHGATFSFRYFTGFKRSRLSLFVSNSKKEAGQLTILRDWLLSTWQATLDTGKGYMDPKSNLGFPIYEPTKVLVKATAGLSTNRRKIHFGVVNGEMSVSSNINLWKPETVPADLAFFFVGAKLNDDNTLGYASHWRIRPSTVKSPFVYFKEVLIDPWTKVKSMSLGTSTINKLLKPVAQSKSNNIDTDVVLDILTSISSNDIDALKRWTTKARENNEFLSNTIGSYITSAFYLVKSGVESWAVAVKSLPYADALPSDFGILAGIGRLSDIVAGGLSRIPIARIWSTTLSMIKYGSDIFSQYFSQYVNRVSTGLREKISGLTGGSGSSIIDMVYNAIASVYPIGKAIEKFSRVVEVSTDSLVTADLELLSQVGTALQPFFVSTLGEIPKVYEFLENLFYEINQWSVYLSGLIEAIGRDSRDKIQKSIPGRTAFNQNLVMSLGLFVVGDYSGAIRQYFNTDANVVRVWRVTCDQACVDSGSFAAINGTIYLPFDTSAVKIPTATDQMMSPYDGMRYRSRIGSRKLSLDKLRSEKGVGGVIRKLISPEHRTAEATATSIKTFDGKELTNLSPCRYLLAHDFQNGDFSIYQTYTWDGSRRTRGDLLVRFFKLKAVISNRNELKLNDVAATVPVSRTIEDKSVQASSTGDAVTVTFSGDLQNSVIVKCRRSRDSCSVRVHPLYHGRVNGALGSNDGNAENDLHAKSDSEHMRLWVADSCVQS